MPWNFPLWQVVRFAAPALMAGNVGLLKHASNVPQMRAVPRGPASGAPASPTGCFHDPADRRRARSSRSCATPACAAATLTGIGARRAVGGRDRGDEIKKTVLELGGTDPFIVMPSADLERAAEVAVTARCQNNGQSCIAAKRFIVHTDVYDAVRAGVRRADGRR